jgi:hypothetical protein
LALLEKSDGLKYRWATQEGSHRYTPAGLLLIHTVHNLESQVIEPELIAIIGKEVLENLSEKETQLC